MEETNLTLFLSIAIPMLMTLLICKGRSRVSMLFVIIGMTVCLFSGEVNALLYPLTGHEMRFFAVNVSPLIEEICKSVPLFLYAFILRPKQQNVLQSAVSLGVGFAILENAAVLVRAEGTLTFSDVLFRSCGSGLVHAITALWVGCGILFVYLNRKLFLSGSLALLTTAAIYHSIFNALIDSRYAVFGLLLPILTLFPLAGLLLWRTVSQKKNRAGAISGNTKG